MNISITGKLCSTACNIIISSFMWSYYSDLRRQFFGGGRGVVVVVVEENCLVCRIFDLVI